MRPEDRDVFSEAATRFKAWILVRLTNKHSLRFVGRAGFHPKPMNCKPKTADVDPRGKQIAGLVVDPTKVPEAFSHNRRTAAGEIWRDFSRSLQPGSRAGAGTYTVENNPSAPHFGCVRYNGSLIYGDYDLFDIVPVGHERRNLALVKSTGEGAIDMRGARVSPVQSFINQRLNVEMIQHGANAQFTVLFEDVDAFGPSGEREHWPAAKVKAQYAEWKRPLLDPFA